MKTSTTTTKSEKGIRLWVVLAWLIIWQIAAMLIDSEILLVTPIKVVCTLFKMLLTKELYKAVAFTLVRIMAGFLLALIFGTFFGALSLKFLRVREFLKLPVSVIKATPVATFIILVLIWIPSRNLSVFISFLIAFPIFYTNVYEGLVHMDKKLLEMSTVFKIPFSKRLKFIYIPEVIPFFKAACDLSLGMCFKAGIAAEIIGLPKGSIGEKLYEAKIYLETPELFAYTLVIITVSFIATKLVLYLLSLILKKMEGR